MPAEADELQPDVIESPHPKGKEKAGEDQWSHSRILQAPKSDFDHSDTITSVVPAFLDLAEFYISNDRVAKAARDEIGREAFFPILYDELRILYWTLNDWGQKILIPEYNLTQILKLLNGRCLSEAQRKTSSDLSTANNRNQGTSNKNFPKLRDLSQQLDEAKNRNTRLDIKVLQGLISLKEKHPKRQKHMEDCIAGFNDYLSQRKPKNTSKDLQTGSGLIPIARSLPTSNIRENAKTLHRLLTHHWICEGHEPHRSVKLRLATHRSVIKEVGFNFVFCAKSESSLKWQQSEAKVLLTQRKPSSPYAYDSSNTKRSSELRQKKMVTWPNEPIDNSRSVGAVQETRVSGNFCRILQKYAADDRSCLNLLVKNESLYLQTASVTPNDEHKQEFISLGDFLTSQSKSSSTAVKKKDKLILMVILANGFLHFHQGPWFTREWSKTNILFSIYESHKTPNLARPYLSTQCTSQDDSSESKEPDEIEASLIAHPYPCILALGILFLEIRLGKTIESWRSEYYSDNEVTASWISKISTANEMLDQCIGDTSQDFENAISACLKTDQFSDYHRQRMTLDNSSEFREKIYLDIVQRLENELKDATGCLVEQLDALPSPDKLSLKRALPQQYMSANPSDIKGVAVQGVTSTSVSATGLNEALSITSNCEVCLYDDTDGPGETDKGDSLKADEWIENLNRRVIGFLERMQGSGVQVADRQRFSRRSGQIRVAILDTGISLSDGFYDSYRDRIKSFKSWLNPNGIVEDEDVDRENDSDGHGTHAAALLLKIAPHADIYIARVFRDRRETKSTAAEIHQRIAAAIRHATEVWEVDIITMSFGFDESVRKIEEAIDFAEGKKIVMFAAASNTGGNGNIAWPARSDKVICIYPSDGYGDHCRFSPNPRDYSDNFMVLGHAVQSCWPRHLGSGSKMRKSGTSTATPIAAGIAAIVLEVVRSMPDRPHSPPKCDTDQFRKVWTNAGMKSIFRLMVRKTRSSYDYIEPWKIFDASQQGYSSETVYEKMLHRLKTRC